MWWSYRLLLWLEGGGVVRRRLGLSHPAPAHFVLRNLADRILRGYRQLVGALPARPVIGDEDRVRANRRHYLRLERDGPTARLGRRPIAVGDAELGREPGMHLDARL